MTTELFRTKETSLSGDELLILDVMFWASVTYPMLRQCNFIAQFAEQSHGLSDDELKSTLGRLERDGIITTETNSFEGHPYISITHHGGSLWSAERCPVWERYCRGPRCSAIIHGRAIMSFRATSDDIRDDLLRLYPDSTPRVRKATIRDYGLVHWKQFGQIHVGLASYVEFWQQSIGVDFNERLAKEQAHRDRVESERTWWRSVGELQKFVGNQDYSYIPEV